jgi:NAD(P)-dependent dehydrogenase (short-subunit alcohol dehydrogenase family)
VTAPDPGAPLAGKVAVVTGASRGLGRAIAAALAQAGAGGVVVGYLGDRPGAEASAADVRSLGAGAATVPGDVSDPATHDRLVEAARSAFGRLDVWVNNAGVSVTAPLLETAPADLARMIDVNVLGVFHGSRAAARVMAASGRGGRIVNISSDIGVQGARLFGGYVATKFAVVGLSQVLALELAPEGITVNVVCPGTALTDMVRAELETEAQLAGSTPDAVERAYREAIPLGRFCAPEDVGALVAFLASDAAGYITGQTLLTNGGAVLH